MRLPVFDSAYFGAGTLTPLIAVPMPAYFVLIVVAKATPAPAKTSTTKAIQRALSTNVVPLSSDRTDLSFLSNLHTPFLHLAILGKNKPHTTN